METLVSLAMVKVNWDRHQRDHIENFVPFVAVGLRSAPMPEVSLQELQGSITSTFGLTIPQGALKTIVKRAVKRGYAVATDGVYRRVDAAVEDIDFSETRARLLRQQNALVDKLMDFAEDRYSLTWSPNEAENALLGYMNEQAIPLLSLTVAGRAIPAPTQPTPHASLVVNAFVASLHERDPEGFIYLTDLVKGAMLANALLFPDLSSVGRHFQGVAIYFDTALLLRVLGLAGPELAAPCLELIALLREQHARLRYFEHTMSELKGVLCAIAVALRDATRASWPETETLRYCQSQKMSPSDVELRVACLERDLARLGIHIAKMPEHSMALGVDEVRLKNALNDEVRYRREETLSHDLNALTAIHRLCGGRSAQKIEDCKAVFVTTNGKVVRGAARFFAQEYPSARDAAPYCILDHALTTLVWLKTPLAAPQLPQKQIIADCYAALAPDEALWRRYVEEIDRLKQRGDISVHDYTLLRFSLDARTALVELTYNEPDAFAEGTVEQILERSHAIARQEAEAERDAACTALVAEQEGRRKAEERAERAEKASEERSRELRRKRSENSARLAHYVGWGFTVVASLALVFASVVTSGADIPFLPAGQVRVAVTFIVVVVFNVASAGTLISGLSLAAVRTRLENRMARVIERLLNHITPLDV